MYRIRQFLLIIILLASFEMNSQTEAHKNYLAIGVGKGSYNGDLGNAWFNLEEEWYGFVSVNYSAWMNKSFDLSASITHGDYGHCREADEPVYRTDGTEVLNMLSRLTAGVISVKYKFANGYIMNETSRLAPYVYAGAGVNNISNHWWPEKHRVNTGNYSSINGGLGVCYRVNEKFCVTYNLGFGYFMTDSIDKRTEGRNDMYMQNGLLFGMNF